MSNAAGGYIEGPIIGGEYPTNGFGFPTDSNTMGPSYVFPPWSGVGNNLDNPTWGAADTLQGSKAPMEEDPVTHLARSDGPNPRQVSDVICNGPSVPNSARFNNLFWAYLQFVDHMVDFTPNQSGPDAEVINTPIPAGDPYAYPGRVIPMTRAQYRLVNGVRIPINSIGSFFDATTVYSNDVQRCRSLRLMDGTGKMKTSQANNGEILPPRNVDGIYMANDGPFPLTELFAAGDVRANENWLLLAMHTLFLREHNRRCDEIVTQHPSWAGSDEMIFQHARLLTMGIIFVHCSE